MKDSQFSHIILVLLVSILSLMLTGCFSSTISNDNAFNSANEKLPQLNSALKEVVSEVRGDEFIYRLISEKAIYEAGEEVKLFAELEYSGADEEITIYHAASPFYFIIYEQNRGFGIPYVMDQPLIPTTLKRGEPLIEQYTINGGFSEHDEKAYVEFIKQLLNQGFPDGQYTVNGRADFYITNENGEKEKDYELNAGIDFQVK